MILSHVIFLLFVSSGRADSCPDALAQFEAALAQLPNQCLRDQECSGFYLRLSSCDAPLVLNTYYNPGGDLKLIRLQNHARALCPPSPTQMACAPKTVQAKCVDHRCRDVPITPDPQLTPKNLETPHG